jgi:murein DD-endopeptidase MepM/ murein hydrolase activator NlpD
VLRRVCALVCCLAVVVAVPARSASAAFCWKPPVVGRVTDPFREPPCPYCAGNRGLEYAVAPSTVVRAVATGIVTWAGSIAGVKHVVVQHANGWRATYGKLTETHLGAGDAVLGGARVGTASGEFYFGLRDGDRYIDPEPFLGTLIGRPRLVPIDGTPPRPAPPPTLMCSA